MAIAVQVSGLATIRVGQEGCTDQNLSTLGYTVNGVRIRTESYFDEVHGDEYGGDAGPPIELVYLGERAVVTCELSKWDATVADSIAARLHGKTPGRTKEEAGVSWPGTPVFASTKAYRLVISVGGQNQKGFDFARAVPREPIEINKGTRHSVLMIVFDCYPNAYGVVFSPYPAS